MKHILRCEKCSSYTLKETCPKCGAKAFSPKPAKFNPEDPYADYRRKAKKQALTEKGLV